MPKSKRDKKISLTKTSKKGKALKQHIVDDIRSCVEKYDRIFLFSVQNMRNNKLKNLREEWKNDSRFLFGKNKVIALAMGLTPETEIADGIHKLAKSLNGQCGLLFTNKQKIKVLHWINDYAEEEYARSGFNVSETIIIPEGPLPDFSHAIEPHLRQLGMPTALQKGVVTLLKDFEVCKKSQPLTPEQARILKLFSKQIAEFKLVLRGFYSKKNGYKRIKTEEFEKNDEQEDMEVGYVNKI